ncbi:MAG: hypothetical protein KA792_02065 [Bacteroidales bacterium]|nr:hypothetical protein [Bacteroidales bacterium]
MKKYYLFLVLIFINIDCFSQLPQFFNYQAIIRDSTNKLILNKDITVKISISKYINSSNIIYSELHKTKTNNFGIINIKPGLGEKIIGEFSNIKWGWQNYFIKIEIKNENSEEFTEMGISQLGSVPFALYAGGLTLTSPDGSHWAVNIDNNGTITSNNVDRDTTFKCGNFLTDKRDNKTYKTVKIGNQCWMAENLNIGNMIKGTQEQINNNTIEKYCFNNSEGKCLSDGGLYQWNEAMDYRMYQAERGICPYGWHIPTDDNFKELEQYIGLTIEETELTGWRGENKGSLLITGGSTAFDALYSGSRKENEGSFVNYEEYACFWSSTINNTDKAFNRNLSIYNNGIYRGAGTMKSGFSIRCLMN